MHVLIPLLGATDAIGPKIVLIAEALKGPLVAIGTLAFIIAGISLAVGTGDRRLVIGAAAGILIAFFAPDLATLLVGGG